MDSQVAFVDGDWFHVGKENGGAYHISDIDEIIMADERSPASYSAVSVLAEFEEGNTDIKRSRDEDEIVERAVKSPVTLNGNIRGEIDMEPFGTPLAWETLRSIRENNDWESTMAPLELAAAIGNSETTVEMEGEDREDFQIRIK